VLGLQSETETRRPAGADSSDTSAGEPDHQALLEAQIQSQIEARQAAKADKNFQEADRIRDALKAQGIELIDKSGGLTEWLRNG
jgi:cysteinyl-tRNA synthetase